MPQRAHVTPTDEFADMLLRMSARLDELERQTHRHGAALGLTVGALTADTITVTNELVAATLRLPGSPDVDLGSSGPLLLGPEDGLNLTADNNEIQARNDGAASSLFLNNEGGNVFIGSPTSRLLLETATGEVRDHDGRQFVRTNTLASPQMLQRGIESGTTDGSGELSVTFDEPYTSVPAVAPAAETSLDRFVSLRDVTTTGFTIVYFDLSAGTVAANAPINLHWVAVGTNTAIV